MRDPSQSPRPGSPRLSFMIVIAILAMIVVPAGLTLHTVHLSALNPATATTPGASPYGYTVSLLLFIVPILVIAFWFVPQEGVKIEKKSFLWTIGLLFPIGAGLDFFFARYFFIFPNDSNFYGTFTGYQQHLRQAKKTWGRQFELLSMRQDFDFLAWLRKFVVRRERDEQFVANATNVHDDLSRKGFQELAVQESDHE